MTNLEGVTKTQISKTQTSDPEKLRPLCVSKTQIPEKLRPLEKRRPVGVSKKTDAQFNNFQNIDIIEYL